MLGFAREGKLFIQQRVRERERGREMEDEAQMKKKKTEKGMVVSKSMVEEGHPIKGGCNEKKNCGNTKRRGKGLELEQIDHMLSIHKENLSKREIHVYSERSRRRKMTHMFSNVISLLPHANPKRDRSMLLMDLICYIKALQNKVEEMGSKKQKLLRSTDDHKTNANPNHKDVAKVEVNKSGADLIITINGAILRRDKQEKEKEKYKEKEKEACKRRIRWSRILEALHALQLEVVTTTLSATIESHFLFIHAKILDMATFRNKEEIELILLQLFF